MNPDSPNDDEPPAGDDAADHEDLAAVPDNDSRGIEITAGTTHLNPTDGLARQLAEATRPIRDMVNLQLEPYQPHLDAVAQEQLSSAMRSASDAMAAQWSTNIGEPLAEIGQRVLEQHAQDFDRVRSAVESAARRLRPQITDALQRARATVNRIYRLAIPPNWRENDPIPLSNYADAIALILEEGVPLAWVPDPDTLNMLIAASHEPDRRAALRAVLAHRTDAILDHCGSVLDQLAADPGATQTQLSVDVAREAVQALRTGLIAPAQSAAANLLDHLLRRLWAGTKVTRYSYNGHRDEIAGLPAALDDLPLDVGMRELATLIAVPKALVEWYPSGTSPLPDTFSRHTTAHWITEPNQVNPINALIAVMLAVSLLCQETSTGWVSLNTLVWSSPVPTTTAGSTGK